MSNKSDSGQYRTISDTELQMCLIKKTLEDGKVKCEHMLIMMRSHTSSDGFVFEIKLLQQQIHGALQRIEKVSQLYGFCQEN